MDRCRWTDAYDDHAEQSKLADEQRHHDRDLPAARRSAQRNIKYVSIINTDLSTGVDITVQKFDGLTTSIEIPTFTLGPLYGLYYEDGRGWYLVFRGANVVMSMSL